MLHVEALSNYLSIYILKVPLGLKTLKFTWLDLKTLHIKDYPLPCSFAEWALWQGVIETRCARVQGVFARNPEFRGPAGAR